MPKRRAFPAFHSRVRWRAAADALREKDELLDLATAAAGAGIWDWRIDTGEMAVNERWAGVLGYTLEELLPIDIRTFERLLHPDDAPRSAEVTRRYLAREISSHEIEIRMRHKDGHWVWLLDRGKAVEWDAGGAPLRAIGMHFDISERKRMETALAESQERLEMAIEGSGVGLWDRRFDTGEVGYNEQWARILGYSLTELQAFDMGPWERLTHPDDLRRAGAVALRHYAGELPVYECEVRMRHKDGHWVWILTRGKVMERDAEGRPLRMVGTHLDISERKRYEGDLQRLLAQEENLLRELQHRVKNNLGVIISLLNLQMSRLEEGPARSALADAQARIRSMSSIYERLYSKDDMGNIDVGAYLGDLALALLSAYAVVPGRIRLERDFDPLRLDAARSVPLGLILNELLTNALKHAFPGDREGNVRVGLGPRGGSMVLSVADDGVGLPPAFDHSDASGLGFTLVRALVDQLGGLLRVEGAGGTRIEVEFKAER